MLGLLIFDILNSLLSRLKLSRGQHSCLYRFPHQSIGRFEIIKGWKFWGTWIYASPWLPPRVIDVGILRRRLVLTLLRKFHNVNQWLIRDWFCLVSSSISIMPHPLLWIALRLFAQLLPSKSFLTHEDLAGRLVTSSQETPRFIFTISLPHRWRKHLWFGKVHTHAFVVTGRLISASIALIPFDDLNFLLQLLFLNQQSPFGLSFSRNCRFFHLKLLF